MRDPLKYKWSFLSSFDGFDNSDSSLNIYKPTNSTIQASVHPASRLGTRNTVIIVFVVIVFICISVLIFYKARQYRRKIKNKNTYQQNIFINENISISEELEKSTI